jgi:haloacetate dehalogenase
MVTTDLHLELLPGFHTETVEANGINLHTAIGGQGPPLLLLHGYPQTHLTWHKVAPKLAKEFTVIAPDLRGYGDSDKPPGGDDHINYSKRLMASDIAELMTKLGHPTFMVLSHDRGARVAHRLTLDHSQRIKKLVTIDIVPTATQYAHTNKEFATRYFWWFFLIQPFDLPERLIGSDPDYFLSKHIEQQIKVPGSVDPRVLTEYHRCFRDPALIHATCEDYRAAAGIDLVHDAEDADKRIECPMMVLWGARGAVGQLYDVLATWRDKARHVIGSAIDCGHSPQEERPTDLLNVVLPFLSST